MKVMIECKETLVENLESIFLERANQDSVIVDIKYNKDLQEELWIVFANMVLTNEIDLFNPNMHEFFNLILPHIAFNIDSLVGYGESVNQLKGIFTKYNTKFQVKQYLPAWHGQEPIVYLGTPILGSEFQAREVLKTFCETNLVEPFGVDTLSFKPTKESYYDIGYDLKFENKKYNSVSYCEKCLEKLQEHIEFRDEILVYSCAKV